MFSTLFSAEESNTTTVSTERQTSAFVGGTLEI